jgi:hypothetical protein
MKKTAVIFSLGLLTLIGAVLLIPRSSPDPKEFSQAEFIAMFQSNLLAKVQVYYPPKLARVGGVPVMLNEVRGTCYRTDDSGQILKEQGALAESAFVARVHLTFDLEQKLTTRTNFSFVSPHPLVQKISELFVHSK